jgi:uncharacterized protein
VTLFDPDRVVGTFLGFSAGGLEFHADLILPYRSYFQSSPMHGQFVLVALEDDEQAVLGRITAITAQGRLVSAAGEDYALRQQRENRTVPEDLRDQFLKYRVDIRILGVLRDSGAENRPVFVPSHRRLPHVGAKVALLSDALLLQVSGAAAKEPNAVPVGFLAFGEFVYAGNDPRVGRDGRLQLRDPAVLPRFDISHLVSRRSFVFARAGFGKSNLVKLLFADLYGGDSGPSVTKRAGRTVPVGTVIFDPDGEYSWPDDKGRPGLCDVPALRDRLVVFTDKEAGSAFYGSFVVDKVKLDIRELAAGKVISLVIPAERQDNQNVVKLKGLRGSQWRDLVDAVYRDRGGTSLQVFYDILQLQPDRQEAEALAARSNMVRVVTALHDPSSQLLRGLERALAAGRLCVVDISQMRGAQGLALAGVLLQRLFERNQEEFTKKDSRSVPTIAVLEEAQSVLGPAAGPGEEPFVAWVKEGRKYDLGALLVTQQPGSIPQEILSQGDNWFVFHLLSEGDLRAVKKANAHFSDDLLSSLLNEPMPGHGVFWSSAGATPYPIPVRALLFEAAYQPLDPRYDLNGIDCYAARLRSELTGALDAAVQAAGGKPVTVAGTQDVNETYKLAAVRQLAEDADFQDSVRGRGIPWGAVHKKLAHYASPAIGDRFQWVHGTHLVRTALDDILGPGGWRTQPRPGRAGAQQSGRQSGTQQWITATDQARARTESVPGPPRDWGSDDPPADGWVPGEPPG